MSSILPESSIKRNTSPSFAAWVTSANQAMTDVVRLSGGFFRMVQQIIIGLGSTLPALAAPVSPATFAGWAVFQATPTDMDTTLRVLVAVAAALALETVGLSAAHVTLYFYSQWQAGHCGPGRVRAGLGLVIAYVLIGIGVIWLVEDLGTTVRSVGTGAFLLAVIAYATLALFADLERMEAEQQATVAQVEAKQAKGDAGKQAEIDFERQRQLKNDERQFQLQLKQMENDALITKEAEETKREKARLNSRLKLARPRSEPAQASSSQILPAQSAAHPAQVPLRCDWCGTTANAQGKPILTSQALNAHKQFCSDRPKEAIAVGHNGHSTNGHNGNGRG